jgi:TM2 domain-containing membrane protein YozV
MNYFHNSSEKSSIQNGFHFAYQSTHYIFVTSLMPIGITPKSKNTRRRIAENPKSKHQKTLQSIIMMKCLKTFTVLSVLVISLVALTSAIPAGENVENPTKVQTATLALEKAAADGKVSYREMKSIAEDLKGSKLTLKEKIALKLFGKKIASKANAAAADGKSQVIALILVLVVGGLGIHRFYLGYTWQGVVQLLTLGGCGIWALIDLIRIITGDLKPKDGEYDVTL